jgi:hypothetical protein
LHRRKSRLAKAPRWSNSATFRERQIGSLTAGQERQLVACPSGEYLRSGEQKSEIRPGMTRLLRHPTPESAQCNRATRSEGVCNAQTCAHQPARQSLHAVAPCGWVRAFFPTMPPSVPPPPRCKHQKRKTHPRAVSDESSQSERGWKASKGRRRGTGLVENCGQLVVSSFVLQTGVPSSLVPLGCESNSHGRRADAR